MIEKIEITEVHSVPDDQVRDYIKYTIGKLDKYIPKNEVDAAYAEVILTDNRGQNKKKHSVEVILHLPHRKLSAKEATDSVPEAVDLVEAKLRQQLVKYKETRVNPKLIRRLAKRLSRR